MEFDAFFAAAERTVIDDREVEALRERMDVAERLFESEATLKAVTNEFMSRTYSM
ncbi:hypothetical protein [Paraburkholderia fynbosensis]|uniref:Uncharacterized protein n=1 Tax=Paraburkholderia fynbosensis TaxID=1200993 RepID=A0A6J5FL32_9BURK|nr:hypothetical protein [Paraburkholderia fynbosensis]CAB3780367.1 hypothetical protein LMG27177_00904 [Paraburkholderia fynbosensis]